MIWTRQTTGGDVWKYMCNTHMKTILRGSSADEAITDIKGTAAFEKYEEEGSTESWNESKDDCLNTAVSWGKEVYDGKDNRENESVVDVEVESQVIAHDVKYRTPDRAGNTKTTTLQNSLFKTLRKERDNSEHLTEFISKRPDGRATVRSLT